MNYFRISLLFVLGLFSIMGVSQDYYKDYTPFNSSIPSPEEFLGYKIGEQHTRHDQVIAYFELLARLSPKVSLYEYGRTHENRKLLMLTISSYDNMENIDSIKKKHIDLVNPLVKNTIHKNLPLFINLGYNVHGNEPSGTESALLTAYTLAASLDIKVADYLDKAIFFIDPVINPDGRDRHTQWVNSRKSKNLVSDPFDVEHTESWPNGRTNHYWFDLNRDWLLAVHPESQAKLKWFHEWYPNIVTDFHEMRTSSNTFFFEPKKISGSVIPMATKENVKLNEIFAKEFSSSLETLGTFYFTSELFDATYPGYGSTYGDLQGALALLFEQTSTRGHLKDMEIGTLSFGRAILNQYIAGMTTIKTAIINKDLIYNYQQNFFRRIKQKVLKKATKAYIFPEITDLNRSKAFIELLQRHHIKVYKTSHEIFERGTTYHKGEAYIVPTYQNQYKMVQSFFETYKTYRDSVFYDASAWSVANFYNIPFQKTKKKLTLKKEVNLLDFPKVKPVEKANYAYIIPWTDYLSPAFLYGLQKADVKVKIINKELVVQTKDQNTKKMGLGSLMIPLSNQSISKDSIFSVVTHYSKKLNIPVTPINAGNNGTGINLGSRSLQTLVKPKVLLWVGEGVSPYEAGEVWHLTDIRLNMPISKISLYNFNRIELSNYNVMVMVSGNYKQLGEFERKKIKNWVADGNTLITIRGATSWAIKKELVKEQLLFTQKDTLSNKRLNYGNYSENYGKERVGGAIFELDLDITHPIAYGYTERKLPIYKNNDIWLQSSKSAYSTVAKYSKEAHIDGYISDENYSKLLKSVSIVVSPIGKGRVVLFADNPNFRGAWYGTNKLFLNAIFFGSHIKVPN